MAAPTSVRVEATSISSTLLRWVYGGSNLVEVYRSTDGSVYASVAIIAVGTVTYTDTELTAGTKYWYKLTDDNGSTFSSVVTVYTHFCVDVDGEDQLRLPRHGGGDPVEEFDEMAIRIEQVLGDRVLNPQQCAKCPSDGAIVLNCSDGCHDFVIIADEDINSVSIQWCDQGEGNIELIIPPNTTRQICGWPGGMGFSGDECFRAPIVTGSAGKSMNVGMGPGAKALPGSTQSRTGYTRGGGRSSGGSTGAPSCTCVPNGQGALTIKSCNANNSLACSGAKSLTLIACGGRPPYTWSNTGSVTLSRTSGGSIVVTPPANAGSGVAGQAYDIEGYNCNVCFTGTCLNAAVAKEIIFGCNDQVLTCDAGPLSGPCSPTAPSAASMTCHNGNCAGTPGAISCTGVTACNDTSFGNLTTAFCDGRTAPMIAAGCVPCGVNSGATVTVTDAVGVAVTVILRA